MTAFCTYFDRNYLPQGLALYRSLINERPTAELWILCLDDETRAIIDSLGLGSVKLISVDDLLEFEPRLVKARADRTPLEFYYACTPQLIRYVAAKTSAGGVTYVDADIFFFGDPAAIYDEAPNAEILLVEHRSGDPKAEAERGRFNVCFIHFEPTSEAARALDWWCEMTLRSTAMDAETWGDQKYLDRFPDLFGPLGILRSPRTTLAPWNCWQHTVTTDGRDTVVDGQPLVAYHFARLLVAGPHLFSPARREWLPRPVLDSIYRPYARAIRRSLVEIRSVSPRYSVSYMSKNRRGLALGLLLGRFFYEGRLGIRRLGIYVPNSKKELRVHARLIRRRLAARSSAIQC